MEIRLSHSACATAGYYKVALTLEKVAGVVADKAWEKLGTQQYDGQRRDLMLCTIDEQRIVLVWVPATRTVITVLAPAIALRNLRNDHRSARAEYDAE